MPPSTTIPQPIPRPIVTTRYDEWSRPIPYSRSAAASVLTSLSTRTGVPIAARSTEPTGADDQPSVGASTMPDACESTDPGTPTPTPSSRSSSSATCLARIWPSRSIASTGAGVVVELDRGPHGAVEFDRHHGDVIGGHLRPQRDARVGHQPEQPGGPATLRGHRLQFLDQPASDQVLGHLRHRRRTQPEPLGDLGPRRGPLGPQQSDDPRRHQIAPRYRSLPTRHVSLLDLLRH